MILQAEGEDTSVDREQKLRKFIELDTNYRTSPSPSCFNRVYWRADVYGTTFRLDISCISNSSIRFRRLLFKETRSIRQPPMDNSL